MNERRRRTALSRRDEDARSSRCRHGAGGVGGNGGRAARRRTRTDPRSRMSAGRRASSDAPLISTAAIPRSRDRASDITHEIGWNRTGGAPRRLAQSENSRRSPVRRGHRHERTPAQAGSPLELLMETSAERAARRRDLRRIYHEADPRAKIVRNLGGRRLAPGCAADAVSRSVAGDQQRPRRCRAAIEVTETRTRISPPA